MGYGVPAALAMQRLYPERRVVCMAGDGDFLMHGQEFATAVQYGLPIIVVLLDNRVVDQVTTRRLRVVKYRGSAHGTNEYPFLIDEQGISVFPVTSAGLDHQTSEEVVSSGIDATSKPRGSLWSPASR